MPTKITEIRCSKLSRAMSCAGFEFMDLPPQAETEPAREGTAAGEYLRALLEGGSIGTHASNGKAFDSDMDFFTKPIAEEIIGNNDSGVLCEQRIDWQTRSGIWIRGQYDASFVRGGDLYVDDLKYGWGIVEANENWQLLGYAIGEVMRRGQAFNRIYLRIHQPRPHHEDGTTRVWELNYIKLLEYKERIEQRMELLAAGHNTLTTGPQCKYCPAAAEKCPAFNKALYRGVEIAHDFLQDSINDEELAFQLELVDRVKDLIKIKSDSLQALALDRIRSGRIIKGYVQEATYGDREWVKTISPETIKVMTGIDITERIMLSPFKAQKAGIPKAVIDELVTREFKGNKIKRKDAKDVGDKIFGKQKPEGVR